MRYARSDIHGFTPPGGVCPGHDEPADSDSHLFSVDCAACDPFLAADPLWASSPDDVPTTPAEKKAAEKIEKESQVTVAQLAEALGGIAKDKVLADAAAQPKPRARRKPAKTTA